MGFQLYLFFGVKEIFFFQLPRDLPLGLELGLRWSSDDDHPFADIRAFCWGNLDGGPGELGQLLDVCALLPDDGAHSLGRDEEVHNLLLRVGVVVQERAELVMRVQAGEAS